MHRPARRLPCRKAGFSKESNMIRTGLHRLAATAAFVVAVTAADFANAADMLTVTSWGGAYTKSQEKASSNPLPDDRHHRAGTGVGGETARSGHGRDQAGNGMWSTSSPAMRGCDEGWLERSTIRRWAARTPCRAPPWIVPSAPSCSAPSTPMTPQVSQRRPDHGRPVGRHPGAAPCASRRTTALIADGVSPKDVYNVGTKAGVDRAFKRRDQAAREGVVDGRPAAQRSPTARWR
jgi:putative spermidine/putrescine transport system substrate-binding protein